MSSETTTPQSDQSAESATPGVDDSQKKIQDLEAQVKEKEAKYLYLYAEFDNFRKRAIKERVDAVKYAAEPLAREILPIMDNLERGLAFIPQGTDANLVEGLKMVLNQFRSMLGQQGIQSVESLSKAFDPHHHEAVGSEASSKPSGTIIQEHVRGYTIHGRLLRPARVIVSSGPASSTPQGLDT